MILKNYLKKNLKTHLIFDFDMTLVKLVLPWKYRLEGIKNDLIQMNKSIIEQYQSHSISLSVLQNLYIAEFKTKAKKIICESGAIFEMDKLQDVIINKELIEFIKNNEHYRFFLWSSNTKAIIEKVLEQNRIMNMFEKIICREDVNLIKPEIEGFKYLIRDVDVPLNRYLLIGNIPDDEITAYRIGIDFIPVDYFSKYKYTE